MSVIIAITLYKLVSLLVGFGLAYLGFRLFLAGIFRGGGDLNTAFNNNKLVLKKASPGIFFALFGTAVILMAIFQGLDLSKFESPQQGTISLTGEDKIAIDTIKGLLLSEQQVSELSPFETKAINDLISKIENPSQSQANRGTITRGIASEKED